MPWLEKDKVLFIHVPRCGGTSITKHHRVGQKAREGKNLFFQIGIMYYYYRYKVLETANFPFMTYENLFALISFTTAFILVFFQLGLAFPYVMLGTSTTLFFTSTFVFTAPILMRTDWLRRLLMFFLGKVMCGWGSDVNYLVGTNSKGYLFHLTAERCIRYGYVSEEAVRKTSFSIVRNPYSRAVSMYEYNKRAFESFEHFVEEFHRKGMKRFHELSQTDSDKIYCHILPVHAYTHMNGKQVVNTIIKQEHLKRLVGTNWKDSGVPKNIQEALTGIPHANSRKRKMKWQDYYTQKTMDLVLEMYEKDFEIFGYDKHIAGRNDLIPRITVKNPAFNAVSIDERTLDVEKALSLKNMKRSSSVHSTPLSPKSPRYGLDLESESHIGAKAQPRKSSMRIQPPPTALQSQRSERKVSIVNQVEAKLYGVDEAANSNASLRTFKMPNYEAQVEVIEKLERRATSAGEETSEGKMNFGLGVNQDPSKISADAKSVVKPEFSDERKSLDFKDYKYYSYRTSTIGSRDEFERELARKKRSASAFVLHVQ